MKFYKVKYLKCGAPQGRSYTFKSKESLPIGALVKLEGDQHGVIVDDPADLEWVKIFGEDRIKNIVGIYKEETEV